MYAAILTVFFIIDVILIALIMLQRNKGTDLGRASFGVGASTTLFGSSGSSNFITRMTAILATMFFIISLVLGNINNNKTTKGNELGKLRVSVKTKSTQLAESVNTISNTPH